MSRVILASKFPQFPSMTQHEPITPRKLSPQDRRLFNHWAKTFSSFSLSSGAESASSSSTQSSERQHRGCISLVNRLFETSPTIIFLHSELKKIGNCSPPIYCAPCPQAE